MIIQKLFGFTSNKDILEQIKESGLQNTLTGLVNDFKIEPQIVLDENQIARFKAQIASLDAQNATAALSTAGLTEAQIAQVMATEGLTGAQMQLMLTNSKLTKEEQEEILTKIGLTEADFTNGVVTKQVVKEKIKSAVASGALTKAQGKEAMSALELSGANNILVASLNKMKTALMNHPFAIMIALIGATAFAMYKMKNVLEDTTFTAEKNKAALDESLNNLKSVQDEITNTTEQISDLNERITELQELADNGTISITEESELDRLKEENAELQKNLDLAKMKKEIAARETLEKADEAGKSGVDPKFATQNKTEEQKAIEKYAGTDSYSKFMIAQTLGRVVSPEEELDASLKAYQKYSEELKNLNVKNFKDTEKKTAVDQYTEKQEELQKKQNEANEQALKMYEDRLAVVQAYETIGVDKLLPTQKAEYEEAKKATEQYEDWLAIINYTTGDFDKLTEAQLRAVVAAKALGEEGIFAVGDYDQALKDAKSEFDSKVQGLSDDEKFAGNVDLYARPIIIWDEETKAQNEDALKSWDYNLDDFNDSDWSTLMSDDMKIGGDNFKNQRVMFTPITPDGKVLTKDEWNAYWEKLLDGAETPEEILAKDADKANGGLGLIEGFTNISPQLESGFLNALDYEKNVVNQMDNGEAYTVGMMAQKLTDTVREAYGMSVEEFGDIADQESIASAIYGILLNGTDENASGKDVIDKFSDQLVKDSDNLLNIVDAVINNIQNHTGSADIYGNLKDAIQNQKKSKWLSSLNEADQRLLLTCEFDEETTLEELQKLLDEAKKVAVNTPISFTAHMEGLQELSKGLDQLDAIYADVYDKEDFDWSSILKNDDFTAAFGNMTNVTEDYKGVYDEFIKTVSETPSDLNACQDAFDRLTTAYIDNSGKLKTLTDDNKAATIEYLKQKGVANAAIIVEEALIANKAKNIIETKGLTEATIDEIDQLVNESGIAEEDRSRMYALFLAKLDVNNTKINTASDIQQLISLANAAGASYAKLHALQQLMALMGVAKNTFDHDTVAANGSLKGDPYSDVRNPNTKKQEQMLENEYIKKSNKGESVLEYVQREAQRILNEITNEAKLNADDFISKVDWSGGTKTNAAKEQAAKDANKGSGDKEPTEEKFDWIETKISRIERVITNLGKTVSATYKTWSTRNNALAQELDKVNEQITLQQQAYASYMAYANAVPLSEGYKALVRDGALNIEAVTDDDLKEQIKNYQDLYNKALAVYDKIQDLQGTLAELAKTKFDNISTEFDNQISLITHEKDLYQSFLDQVEAQGYIASTKYYEALINAETKNMSSLQAKYSSLSSALDDAVKSGRIEEYSQAWYEMKISVNEVESAIQDANKSLIDYKNNLRQIGWDLFDRQENYISKIQEESDFLVSLVSENKHLFDKDNGNITNNGLAAEGLHAVKYNTYMAQADDYAKEMQKINKELADDPYNTILLDRRDELLKSQQEAIKNAESEKSAIKDLVAEGYNLMLEALDKIIEKRKDALDAARDLYDYEKSVSEQSKTIADYQKQLMALSGDNSEEVQSKIQTIKLSLEDAQKELQETEYDRWMSDQEKLMTDLKDDAQEWVNERLDDINGLIQNVIDQTNANAGTIEETLKSESQNVGYTLTNEMQSIWNSDSGINKIVSDYTSNFQSLITTTNSTLSGIKDLVQAMVDKANKEAADKQAAAEAAKKPVPAPSTSTTSKPSTSTTTSKPNSSSSSGGNSGWGSWFIKKVDGYAKNRLDKENSVVDRMKFFDIDSSFNARAGYYRAMGKSDKYTGSTSQNRWILSEMKAHGYQRGSRNISSAQMAWTQENGSEYVYRKSDGAILTPLGKGDKVYTNQMANFLYDFAKNPTALLSGVAKLPSVLPAHTQSGNVGNITLQLDNIIMNGVNDPESFAKNLVFSVKNDSKVQGILKDLNSSAMLGKNSLGIRKY